MAILSIISPTTGSYGLVLAAAITLLVVYLVRFPVRMDPQEPPILRPRIPFIGHLLGLISLSHGYHRLQFRNYKMPICTLPILGGKLYVINSPDLASSVIRSRTLSFEPYVTDFIRKMTGIGDAAMKIYENPQFFSQWLKIVYSSLTGDHLLRVNSAALKVLTSSLGDIPANGTVVPDLFLWTRDLMTLASTTSLMGRKNPWKSDLRLFNAYWDYEREIVTMMINIFPRLTSPKGFEGRALMQQALTEYFASECDTEEDVPKFTRDRLELERAFGMTPDQMAGLEVAVLHGALSNTIPTAYWMLVYVFSNPELLEKLRAEALAVAKETSKSSQGQRELALDVVRLEEKCPLLFSTLRETQRVISTAVLNRKVMADTVISDGENSYLLKKGNNLQVAHGVTHNLEDVWGRNVGEFDGERFLRAAGQSSQVKSEDDLVVKPGAYTPFGAGKHICPGRFFASGEILGFMVPLILGFDIVDLHGRSIRVPDAATPWITTPLAKPVAGADLSARLSRRVGWENVVWKVAG